MCKICNIYIDAQDSFEFPFSMHTYVGEFENLKQLYFVITLAARFLMHFGFGQSDKCR